MKFLLASFFTFFIFGCAFASTTEQTDDWQRVYLATFQRSGNHWTRYLIEEATYIATGSVYIDREPVHLKKKFPWKGYCAKHGCTGKCRYPKRGEIVVIKTHFPSERKRPFDKKPCIKTVRIVRHPVDSFYSFYIRTHPGLSEDGKIPQKYIKKYISLWKKFHRYWNQQPDVITFNYETLYKSPRKTLKKVLSAIGYKVRDKDIERAVTKYPPTGGILKHLNHFQDEDLALINSELGDLMHQFGYQLIEINHDDISTSTDGEATFL